MCLQVKFLLSLPLALGRDGSGRELEEKTLVDSQKTHGKYELMGILGASAKVLVRQASAMSEGEPPLVALASVCASVFS